RPSARGALRVCKSNRAAAAPSSQARASGGRRRETASRSARAMPRRGGGGGGKPAADGGARAMGLGGQEKQRRRTSRPASSASTTGGGSALQRASPRADLAARASTRKAPRMNDNGASLTIEEAWRKYDDIEVRLTACVSERMLDLAEVRPGTRVIDLASGR